MYTIELSEDDLRRRGQGVDCAVAATDVTA